MQNNDFMQLVYRRYLSDNFIHRSGTNTPCRFFSSTETPVITDNYLFLTQTEELN